MNDTAPNKINIGGKPKGVVKLSRKGLGVVFGLGTAFIVALAWGVMQQKQEYDSSAPAPQLLAAMDNSIQEKLDQQPDQLIEAKKEQPTIIDNTVIMPAAETPVTNQVTQKQKPEGPSLLDVLAKKKYQALESAVISTSDGNSSQGGSSSNSNTSSSRTQVAGVGGLTPDQIKELIGSGTDQDPNKQLRKESFLKSGATQDYPNGYLGNTRTSAISPYEIKQGTVIPSVMVGGLNSDLPGYIKAMVSEDVYDTATGDYLLIPKGSQLIGVYDSRIAYGQSRVLVVWRRVVFPDASAMDLENMPGMDEGGFSGLFDKVDNHYFKIFGAGLILSLFQAGYDISTDNDGFQQSDGDTAVEAISKQMSQIGMEFARRGLQIQPTIEIRNGKQFNVFVHKDIIFKEPYEHNFVDVAEYESRIY